MRKVNLQAVIEAFSKHVQKRGWSIIEDKAIDYGRQLTVTDGRAKTPVALYSSGKALVQGKPSTLQTELKKWCYGSLTSPKRPNEAMPTQLPLIEYTD